LSACYICAMRPPHVALAVSASALLLLASVPALRSERLTMTTTYPAPSGVYTQLVATGNAYLARDGGKVLIGGTVPTSAKLSVEGGAAFTGTVTAADLQVAGRSAATTAVCAPDTGLSCSLDKGELHITKASCVAKSCAAAKPGCGETSAGVDDCGHPCALQKDACVPGKGLPDPPAPCGGWYYREARWTQRYCK
jgi:hypothetical protein